MEYPVMWLFDANKANTLTIDINEHALLSTLLQDIHLVLYLSNRNF